MRRAAKVDASALEVRRNPDGSVDEIIGAASLFHLEQMNNGHWWIGVKTVDGRMHHINLYTERNAAIHARYEADA